MKMVKKILLGLAAGAVVLGFAGCKEAGGNEDLIKVSGSSASIDYTNENGSVTRGFKTLGTKHLDAICHISMDVTGLNGSGQVSNGTMGYIFNLVKNADDTYNFTIAAARYNQSTQKTEAYVETFTNVAADKLEDELSGGSHATGKTWGNTAYGFNLNVQPVGGKLDLWIDVVAQGQGMVNNVLTDYPNRTVGAAGTYKVKFFDKDPGRKLGVGNYDLKYTNTSVTPIAELTVEKKDVNTTYDTTKGLNSMQAETGFYANVYAGQTLKGTWKFEEIMKEAEEIVE